MTHEPATTLSLKQVDVDMLRRLLLHLSDHGGGEVRWPDCHLTSCVSCQASHLHFQLFGGSR